MTLWFFNDFCISINNFFKVDEHSSPNEVLCGRIKFALTICRQGYFFFAADKLTPLSFLIQWSWLNVWFLSIVLIQMHLRNSIARLFFVFEHFLAFIINSIQILMNKTNISKLTYKWKERKITTMQRRGVIRRRCVEIA